MRRKNLVPSVPWYQMWDKYSVDNVDDEKGESDSGITSESLDSEDYNKDVERRIRPMRIGRV